uniref:hypothetical protein n=1 Tax=Paracoccus sp. TRP TaxID=412597 RepID=UPI000225F659|nr:hypothetical protein [Paracoccus sp. TRP]
MHTPFSPPAAVPAGLIAEVCLRDLDRVERLRAAMGIKLTPPPWGRAITLPSAEYREIVQ